MIHGLLNTNKNYDAKNLMAKYNPKGTNSEASFIITDKNLKQAEEEVIGFLKEKLH